MKGKNSCRTPYDRPHKMSDKRKLSSDAKVIIQLMKRQPQKPKDLSRSAGIDISSVYRMLRMLVNNGLLKETDKGYALWFYKDFENKMDTYLQHLKNEDTLQFPLEHIAAHVGIPPDNEEFRKVAYRLLSKHDLRVGPRIVMRALGKQTRSERIRETEEFLKWKLEREKGERESARKLEEKVDKVLKKLKEWEWEQVTLSYLANEVHAPPSTIVTLAYRLAGKYDLKVGKKIVRNPKYSVTGFHRIFSEEEGRGKRR